MCNITMIVCLVMSHLTLCRTLEAHRDVVSMSHNSGFTLLREPGRSRARTASTYGPAHFALTHLTTNWWHLLRSSSSSCLSLPESTLAAIHHCLATYIASWSCRTKHWTSNAFCGQGELRRVVKHCRHFLTMIPSQPTSRCCHSVMLPCCGVQTVRLQIVIRMPLYCCWTFALLFSCSLYHIFVAIYFGIEWRFQLVWFPFFD